MSVMCRAALYLSHQPQEDAQLLIVLVEYLYWDEKLCTPQVEAYVRNCQFIYLIISTQEIGTCPCLERQFVQETRHKSQTRSNSSSYGILV